MSLWTISRAVPATMERRGTEEATSRVGDRQTRSSAGSRTAGCAHCDWDSGYTAGARLRRNYPAGCRVLSGRFGRARLCRRKPHLDEVVLGPARPRVAQEELHL